jgi:hypothetical protein
MMTGPERGLRAFTHLDRARGLDGVAEQLLDWAAECGAVRVEKVLPSADHPDAPATFELADGSGALRTTELTVARLFRPLLARLAVIGATEMGGEPPLYGGRVVITRATAAGPARLDVDLSNVLGCQRLRITRLSGLVRTDPLRTSEPAAG